MWAADDARHTPAPALGIVIATLNRRDALARALDAIAKTTDTPHTIVVVDGGSTDGTLELLEERRVRTIRQGVLVGTARAYNEGFAALETPYACWLSDDTDVLYGALDTAVAILESDGRVGMVGLKMREARWSKRASKYMGGVSCVGVHTCNHGVIRRDLLVGLGGFHEEYRAYMIDPDLTVSVLAAGWRVVLTKRHAVNHHRLEPVDQQGKADLKDGRRGRLQGIYNRRWLWLLDHRPPLVDRPVRPLLTNVYERIARGWPKSAEHAYRYGLCRRDLDVLTRSRWISPLDPVLSHRRPFHLVQRLPQGAVRDPRNPVAREGVPRGPAERRGSATR